MEILGGFGRNMSLKVPPGTDVRPTSVRTRRAFFDMLGDLSGMIFCDLFAGSGAMGLEAASRGAGEVIFIERSPAVLSVVKENIRKSSSWSDETVFHVNRGSVPECLDQIVRSHPAPDIIFGDPPYRESVTVLDALLRHKEFTHWAEKSILYWEMPDFRTQLNVFPEEWTLESIRDFGTSKFLLIRSKNGK